MTHFEFMQLSSQQQYHIVAMEGVEIARRNNGLNQYFLYQLYSFYVEVKFHCTTQQLAGIRSFTDSLALDSYLENIDVSSLVK